MNTQSLRVEFEKARETKIPECLAWDEHDKSYRWQIEVDQSPLVIAAFSGDINLHESNLNAEFRGFCLAWVARAKVDAGICEEKHEEIKSFLDEAYRFHSTSPRAKENINAACDLLDEIAAAIKQDVQE